jgi:hypothetical protein
MVGDKKLGRNRALLNHNWDFSETNRNPGMRRDFHQKSLYNRPEPLGAVHKPLNGGGGSKPKHHTESQGREWGPGGGGGIFQVFLC